MKNILCILKLFLIIFPIGVFSQNEANIWYFGRYAGIDFNGENPVPLTNSAMNQNEGCASISDKNGNLLFYTDGQQIWNKNHDIMSNGSGLMGHPSATQSGVIVPHPGDSLLYYVFTVYYEVGNQGLRYSLVDMSANGGLGAVTDIKNEYLIGPTEEKITAVKHANNEHIWVITHTYDTDLFYSYLVTQSGINTNPVISQTGAIHSGPGQWVGCLRASPDGKKLAVTVRTHNTIEVLDFNNETGEVSNPLRFLEDYERPYGIEFSPDGSKLYLGDMTNGSQIHQFDLEAGSPNAVINSALLIGTVDNQHLGALQLAPDLKIYVSKHDNLSGDFYLGVINNPNERGATCNFVEDGFFLNNRRCIWGLPNFIQSYFKSSFDYKNLCLNDTTEFLIADSTIVDSALWNFGDPSSGTLNTSNLLNPIHVFTQPGTFNVTLIAYGNGKSDTVVEQLFIKPLPEVDLGSDKVICEGEPLMLEGEPGMDTYLWHDSSDQMTFEVINPGLHWLEVSLNGCKNRDSVNIDINPIPEVDLGNDTTLTPSQTIVLDAGNPGAYYLWSTGDTSRFIEVGPEQLIWVEVTEDGCTGRDSIMIYMQEYFGFNNHCYGDTTLFHLIITEVDSVNWRFGDPLSGDQNFSNEMYPIHIFTEPGIYDISLTIYFNGGIDTIVQSLQIFPLPEVDLGNDTSFCAGDQIRLQAESGMDSYRWQDNSSEPFYIVRNPGSYWLRVGRNGCHATDTILINQIPPPYVDLGNDTSLIASESIVLDAGNPGADYLWSTGDTTRRIEAEAEQIIWVEVLRNGCSGGDTIEIYLDTRCIAAVPNAFSPNGDNQNDIMYVRGRGFETLEFSIFNRFGEMIFFTNDPEQGWDGTYKGEKQNIEVYYYYLKAICVNGERISKKGTITLLR